MEDIIKAIFLLNEEIREIKRQIELLKKRRVELFKEEWVDGQDVMLALNITQRTLRTLRESGKIAYSRVEKRYYYKVADISALLEENYIRYHIPTKI